MKKIHIFLLTITILFASLQIGVGQPCWADLRQDLTILNPAGQPVKNQPLINLLKSFQPKEIRLDAWRVARLNDDPLSTDVTFLSRLNEDIHNPSSLPAQSSPRPTPTQIKTALENPDIYAFYKKFANSDVIGESMRERYLEAIALDDFITSRKLILGNVFDIKETLLNQIPNLTRNEISRIQNGNLAYGTIDIVGESPIEIISLSGSLSSTLITKMQAVFPDKVIMPKIGAGHVRYFEPAYGNQDAELKVLEYALDRLRQKNSLTFGNNDVRSEWTQWLLEENGGELSILMQSEMKPCGSCSGVVSTYNGYNPIQNLVVPGGTKYYE